MAKNAELNCALMLQRQRSTDAIQSREVQAGAKCADKLMDTNFALNELLMRS